jgi:regulator of extracellular matrix RemA (YlzA/DUF370 family)
LNIDPGELLLLDHVELVSPDLFGAELIGRLAEEARELGDVIDVAVDRRLRVVANAQVIDHSLS